MNDTHDEEHELWLAELLAGEKERDEPEVRSRLAKCPRCAQAFAELAEVSRELSTTSEARARDLDAAARDSGAPGEARLHGKLAELAGESAGRPASPRRSWIAWAAAAVVLAGSVLALRRILGPQPARPAPVELESIELEALAPEGESDFGEFIWIDRASSPAPYGYELVLFDADAPPGSAPFLTQKCAQSGWRPGAEERTRWPARIRWLVRAPDADGVEPLAVSKERTAWRRE